MLHQFDVEGEIPSPGKGKDRVNQFSILFLFFIKPRLLSWNMTGFNEGEKCR